jgi:predicted patatin/cPLA2 family phospholipase
MADLPKANSKKDKVLIVEGGGMRGAFAGGALAAMCKYYKAENFKLAVGVSAGSCSLAYYLTEIENKLISKKKILSIWREELYGNKFISFWELFRKKRIMRREYLIDQVMGKNYKIHTENISKIPFYITVSNVLTLAPEYLLATKDNILELLRSAISLPIATSGKHFFQEKILTDGGVMDPIPLKVVIDKGYKDITLVLNHSRNYISEPISRFFSKLSFPKSPSLQYYLNKIHHLNYNEAKSIIMNPPQDIKLRIIDPKINLGVSILTTKREKLKKLIEHGWSEAEKIFRK